MNFEEIINNINPYNVSLILNGTILIIFSKVLFDKDKKETNKEKIINLKKKKYHMIFLKLLFHLS